MMLNPSSIGLNCGVYGGKTTLWSLFLWLLPGLHWFYGSYNYQVSRLIFSDGITIIIFININSYYKNGSYKII
jgi:hypothetical protein